MRVIKASHPPLYHSAPHEYCPQLKRTNEEHVHQKQQKLLSIPPSHTVVNPHTVMIHLKNTAVTATAVVDAGEEGSAVSVAFGALWVFLFNKPAILTFHFILIL